MARKGIRIGATVGMVLGMLSLFKTYQGSADKSRDIVRALTGYDMASGSFDIKTATAALPMVAGVGLSMVASKVGMNRYTPKGINI